MMFAVLHALGIFIVNLFKSRGRLEAENLLLRDQLRFSEESPHLRRDWYIVQNDLTYQAAEIESLRKRFMEAERYDGKASGKSTRGTK